MKYVIFFDFSGTLVKMRPPKLLASFRLLQKLSNYFELGIVTGARKTETLNILNKLKIRDLFSSVITADDSRYRKPNPKLLPKLKIIAYVGDTKKDERLAKNAKITFFRVNYKYNVNSIIKKLI